jgi:hypothetical protein
MVQRPLGITALAFASIVIGLYCQIAAIALFLGSMVGGVFGAEVSVIIALGALYLGLMVAAYFVGYGFWTQRHWSWAGGLVVFGTFIVLAVLLGFVSANVTALVGLSVASGTAICYLLRADTRSHLLKTAGRPTGTARAKASLGTPPVAP